MSERVERPPLGMWLHYQLPFPRPEQKIHLLCAYALELERRAAALCDEIDKNMAPIRIAVKMEALRALLPSGGAGEGAVVDA